MSIVNVLLYLFFEGKIFLLETLKFFFCKKREQSSAIEFCLKMAQGKSRVYALNYDF